MREGSVHMTAHSSAPTGINVGHDQQEGLAIAVWSASHIHTLQRDGDVHP